MIGVTPLSKSLPIFPPGWWFEVGHVWNGFRKLLCILLGHLPKRLLHTKRGTVEVTETLSVQAFWSYMGRKWKKVFMNKSNLQALDCFLPKLGRRMWHGTQNQDHTH